MAGSPVHPGPTRAICCFRTSSRQGRSWRPSRPRYPGSRTPSAFLHFETDPGVSEMNLIAGLELYACCGAARNIDTASSAQDESTALAVRVENPVSALFPVVTNTGVLARNACLCLRKGEVVTPAQSLAFAHDLRQSPKVEAVRLDLALRRRRAPGRGNHFRRRTLTARARLVYSGLGTRIFDAERPLRPREPGIVDDL